MRTQTVNAKSKKAAFMLCPWASVIVEVDSGEDGIRSWKCFESTEDARIWKNQK